MFTRRAIYFVVAAQAVDAIARAVLSPHLKLQKFLLFLCIVRG